MQEENNIRILLQRCCVWHLAFVWILILLFSAPGSAEAGGVWLYEIGTPDLGVAAAGRDATALDASVAITNPAAMTNLDRPQLMAGLQALFIDTQFSTQESGFGGGDGGNAGGVMPAASFSYADKLNDSVWLGIGMGSYFGLGLNYDDDWSGRYYVKEASLLTAGATVSMGADVTDSFAVGLGLNVLVAKLLMKTAVNNLPLESSAADGELKADATTTGFGGNVGLFYKITPNVRTGLTYRTPVRLKFDDAISFSGLGSILEQQLVNSGLLGKNLDITFTVPQAISFSLHYDFTPRWAVMGSVSWQNWKEFGVLETSIEDTNVSDATIDLNYTDTWHFALGFRGRIAEQWIWSIGAAYDTSPCSESNRSPILPLDRQIRVATGIQYEVDEDVTLGVAYEYLDAGKAKIDREGGPLTGPLKGEYNTNHIQYVAVNMQWKF
ncbi:MAG: OmpP1/FadL family transporter [Halodesulfovibrio sp.]|uniref:OmpP1/FadL family transporter n=1 Tax=Halodesulfovibrio sp. TaxID=1912772 RepID=UPI00359EC432